MPEFVSFYRGSMTCCYQYGNFYAYTEVKGVNFYFEGRTKESVLLQARRAVDNFLGDKYGKANPQNKESSRAH